MKISLTGPAIRNMDRVVGYGEASYHIYKNLKLLGFEIEIESPRADIEISFADPGNYVFYDSSSYKIGYSAWESSQMSQQFKINISKCDELWGTSYWITDIYKKLFPNKEIHTYQHGISESWKPVKRVKRHEPFTFLHIGEPFSRKDAQIVVDSFIELFGNNPNYRLILKCHKINTTRVKHPRGYDCSPSVAYENIYEINGVLSEEQMLGLYQMSDVFVYPSWGEGFGFQPLQSLAMGIPTICVDKWADYKKYITWTVESEWALSPWQDKHPGHMLKPNKESLKNRMMEAVETYEKVLPETFRNSFEIHKEYDWLSVTKHASERLKQIYAGLVMQKEYFDLSDFKRKT